MDLRKNIRKILKEVLITDKLHDQLFNYHSSQSETEVNEYGFRYTVRKYGDKVIDDVIDILMKEHGVSEKDFKRIDAVVEFGKNVVLSLPENILFIEKCRDGNVRTNLCAELIYNRFKGSTDFLFESKKKSDFDKLKDNKIPLTDEERKECFRQDALWHYATSINPLNGKKERKVCAVWKSKNPKTGKITYVTHTHRAYNTATTLQAAINKYHNFIKGTS